MNVWLEMLWVITLTHFVIFHYPYNSRINTGTLKINKYITKKYKIECNRLEDSALRVYILAFMPI